ncbi:MAG: DUF1844 domain-containing protein [Planctomycetota bacterium]|nr:MAG: DUF1844 domain-containing protein [Planctomycetota bacterium]
MAEKEKKEEKKIIIDEDWKQQAQKEKEILAAQEKAEKEKAEEKKAHHGPLPKGDFAALVSTLVTQTLFALGMVKVDEQERKPDLEMAKYNIDMLETLEEKTKGNLSEEEKKVLENTLSQVRMAYVKVAK